VHHALPSRAIFFGHTGWGFLWQTILILTPKSFRPCRLPSARSLAVALGERAKAIAQAAPPEHRKHYLLIADEWLKLAMEMENAASKEAGRD
jgi:hypothetical protein